MEWQSVGRWGGVESGSVEWVLEFERVGKVEWVLEFERGGGNLFISYTFC